LVWLAVWLTLFAALAPSVSYAFHVAASRDAVDLHAVCSSAFKVATPTEAPSTPVWLLGESPQPDDSTAPVGGHCQLCLLSIERLAPPSSSVVGFAIQSATYALPVAPSPQFVKSFLELNPPPRGPPLPF
jgi:hypothetical protein